MVSDLKVDLENKLKNTCIKQGYTIVKETKLMTFSICMDKKNRKVYIGRNTSTRDIAMFISTYFN